MPPREEYLLDRALAEAGHTQELLTRGPVHVDGKQIAMKERPRELGIDLQIEVRCLGSDDLPDLEAVEPHEPVGLVEPVLAHERRRLRRQARVAVRERAERGVVDAPQRIRAIESVGREEDVRVRRRGRSDDDLRALSCRRKRLWTLFLLLLLRDRLHRRFDLRHRLLRRQRRKIGRRRQLGVDAQTIGVTPGLREELGRDTGC
jgi:hypothetical protein